MKKVLLITVLLFLPALTAAQLKSQASGLNMAQILRSGTNSIGLLSGAFLSPDRFQMTQSYSISMGSMGGHSFTQAMYLNTMNYKISDPLSLSLQWGVMMNGLPGMGGLGLNNELPFKNGFFISGAQLKYTPTPNTELKIEFRRNPYGYWGRPYGQIF